MQLVAATTNVRQGACQTVSADIQRDLPPKAQQPRHAGFLVRLAASVLDIIIMGVPVYLAVSLIYGFRLDPEGGIFSTGDLVQFVLLGGMTVFLWVNWDGRTPGKKLTKIRIVSYPGYGSFGYRTATIRTLIGVASLLPFLVGYFIIAIMIAGREDKRGYHDIFSNTCVVHDSPSDGDPSSPL